MNRPLETFCQREVQQKRNCRKGWQNVTGQLRARHGEEKKAEARPREQKKGEGRDFLRSEKSSATCESRPKQNCGPRQKSDENNRYVIPKRLDVLKFGRKVALEIVLDDEDAKEVWIASCTKYVPGKGSRAKRCNGYGMEQAKRFAPFFGEERPEKNTTAA